MLKYLNMKLKHYSFPVSATRDGLGFSDRFWRFKKIFFICLFLQLQLAYDIILISGVEHR